jgi:hypothetical protein
MSKYKWLCNLAWHHWSDWETDIALDGYWASTRVCLRCGEVDFNSGKADR